MPENLSCPVCGDVSMFLFVVIVHKSYQLSGCNTFIMRISFMVLCTLRWGRFLSYWDYNFCAQGEDICVALQTHINDVMLRRYSRTRNATNGQLANGVDAGGIPNTKPPGIEVYEKHVQEMSKLLEESQRKIDQASSQSKKHDGK